MKQHIGVALLAWLALSGCAAGNKNYSHYDKGVFLRQQGNVDGAIAEFQASIAVDPADPTVYDALGQLLYSKGFRDQAIAAWEKALANGSTDPNFYTKDGMTRKTDWIADGINATKAATIFIDDVLSAIKDGSLGPHEPG